jgi:glycosyltransferase involved in cell wall biosynthesis
MKILKNGTHNISHGRNLGLINSDSRYVAYVDSDDYADKNWTLSIIDSFNTEDRYGIVSGPLSAADENSLAKAITINDLAIRQIFGKGILSFITCNCAIDRAIIGDILFNENFKYAEDLEFGRRTEKHYRRLFNPEMKVFHTSRGTFEDYYKQMYDYGRWKQYYAYKFKEYRPIDYVPLLFILISIGLCILSPWSLLTFPIFCICEFAFVMLYKQPGFKLMHLILASWIIKNVGWSLGILVGLFNLLANKNTRTNLLEAVNNAR